MIVTSNGNEFIVDAVERDMSEEAGLELDPGPLLEASEGGEPARTHNVELILLVEVHGVPTPLGHFTTIDLDADSQPDVRPAILKQIASGARDGWRSTPSCLVATASGLPRAQDEWSESH